MNDAIAPASPALPARFTAPTLLGRGAQGETWRAHDVDHDRDVAIKILDLGRVRDWKAFELFERECKVLRSLDHPGTPHYYEHVSDEAAGRFYLVMELVQGRSLQQDLDDGRRRTTTELVGLLGDLLDVLAYLHDLHPRVIHRDVKPGNVIVRETGGPVLVDFGAVARPFTEKGGSTMIGSIGYMAPEQLHGQSGPRSDLYGLAATIAALAAGVGAESLPRKGLRVDLEGILDRGPLRATLEAMLEPEPDDRPASAREAKASLTDPTALAPAEPIASEPSPQAIARREARALAHGKDWRPQLVGGMVLTTVLSVITRSPLLFLVGLVLVFVRPLLAGLRFGLMPDDE